MKRLTAIILIITTYIYLDHSIYGGLVSSLYFISVSLIMYNFIKRNGNYNPKSKKYLIYNILIFISFSIFDNVSLIYQNALAFTLLLYWLIVASGNRVSDKIDDLILKDFMFKSILLPLKKIFVIFEDLLKFKQKDTSTKHKKILAGIFLSLPIFMTVIPSLMVTDQTFNNIYESIFSLGFLENIQSFLVFASCVVASFLYSALYTNSANLKIVEIENKFKQDSIVIKTILNIFIAIYLSYIFSVAYTMFTVNLNSIYEIAKYARNSFFQLSYVTFINLCLFIAAKYFNQDEKSTKKQMTVIGVETIMIIILALSRMYAYVENYGFTILRFITTLTMVLMLIVSIFLILSLYSNFNYVEKIVLIFATIFLVLSYVNIDYWLNTYNLQKNSDLKIEKIFKTKSVLNLNLESIIKNKGLK